MRCKVRNVFLSALMLALLTLPAQAIDIYALPDDQLVGDKSETQPPDFLPEDIPDMPIDTASLHTPADTLMLVNPHYTVPAWYVPTGLTSINDFVNSNGNILLCAEAAAALRQMLTALRAAGISDIFASSGYRTYARQNELYTAKVAYFLQQGLSETAARAQAARWVVPPGQSEHQTGLAVDLSTASISFSLTEPFANTAAGRWLNEHCVEYGFVLRYTTEKEPLTGVASEPWHFRYVGTDHAYYMRQNGLCLEEYHALLLEKNPLIFENAQGLQRAVYYSTASASAALPGEQLEISLASFGSTYYIVTANPPPSAPLFDAIGHWGEQYIMRLHDLGIVNGYLDGSFRPDAGVNRGEFITAFSRLPLVMFMDTPPDNIITESLEQQAPDSAVAEGVEQQAPDSSVTEGVEQQAPDSPVTEDLRYKSPDSIYLPYRDVYPEQYYFRPLQLCYRASLVQVLETKGVQPPLFEANRPLSRGEAALLLAQAFNRQDYQLPTAYSYRDIPPAAGQLFGAVELLTARGVLSGDGDGFFHPERKVSRAEMSAMLCRLLDALLREDVAEKTPTEPPQTAEAPTEEILTDKTLTDPK